MQVTHTPWLGWKFCGAPSNGSQPKPSPTIPASSDFYYAGLVETSTGLFREASSTSRWKCRSLVHFLSEGCANCAERLPELRRMANSMDPGGSVKFVKIESDWNPDASERYAGQNPVSLSLASLREDEDGRLRIDSHPLMLFRNYQNTDAVNCNDSPTKLDCLIRDAIRREDARQIPPWPDALAGVTNQPSSAQGWLEWIRAMLLLPKRD